MTCPATPHNNPQHWRRARVKDYYRTHFERITCSLCGKFIGYNDTSVKLTKAQRQRAEGQADLGIGE
jgi:hypothetical protein